MSNIILSFFAAIGIVLLVVRIGDYLFYRKCKFCLPLVVDLRKKDAEEIIEIFELITTVRNRTSGRAAISDLIILSDQRDTLQSDLIQYYINSFDLRGKIYYGSDTDWKDLF